MIIIDFVLFFCFSFHFFLSKFLPEAQQPQEHFHEAKVRLLQDKHKANSIESKFILDNRQSKIKKSQI